MDRVRIVPKLLLEFSESILLQKKGFKIKILYRNCTQDSYF